MNASFSYSIVTPIIVIDLAKNNIFGIFRPNDDVFTLNMT